MPCHKTVLAGTVTATRRRLLMRMTVATTLLSLPVMLHMIRVN